MKWGINFTEKRIFNKVKALGNLENKKIHLGCGINAPKGWVNVDGSWNAWLAKYGKIREILRKLGIIHDGCFNILWSPDIIIHDVRKSLPFPDNSAEAIYASHLLEHLYLEQEEFLLKECFRVLMPGGVLRIVVPDLRAIIEEYMGKRELEAADNIKMLGPAERMNRRLLLRDIGSPRGSILFKLYTLMKDFHLHKYVHDVDSLRKIFEKANFKEVQEMGYHQSRIKDIQDIEQKEAVINGAGICMEGVKPD
jgi:SAM-dependent methyltransferase